MYSLHKPLSTCIAKGKAGKPYEFGNKVGMMASNQSLIITAVEIFEGNPYDNFKKMMKKLKEESQKALLALFQKLWFSIKIKSMKTL